MRCVDRACDTGADALTLERASLWGPAGGGSILERRRSVFRPKCRGREIRGRSARRRISSRAGVSLPVESERRRDLDMPRDTARRARARILANTAAMSDPATAPAKRHKLVGHKNFKRNNPMSDKFAVHRFHHVEFWCGDASTTSSRFAVGLGMQRVAKSDLSTGNKTYASYALKSNDLMFVFSAASYVPEDEARTSEARAASQPHPGLDADAMRAFCAKHGMAVRAVGVVVDDAEDAYAKSVSNGGRGVMPPARLFDDGVDETSGDAPHQRVAEVALYGDVVLRYVSRHGGHAGTFLPKYQEEHPEPGVEPLCYGLTRLDHAVGNVHDLLETVDYISSFTGFHEFAEFTAEDVGTVDSGLNSMVLANNSEFVLLPVNEPTFGTKRKSQIQTYLEQNEGPGLQHLALKTDDIFATIREMRRHGGGRGGFEFQKPASEDYYEKLPERVGENALTPEQFQEVKELGLLVDKDDQGVLVQVFTKPLGDRPTVFIEIIQRIGCERVTVGKDGEPPRTEQAAGCGGFGKGNFSELFKSIENYERTLKV